MLIYVYILCYMKYFN